MFSGSIGFGLSGTNRSGQAYTGNQEAQRILGFKTGEDFKEVN